MFFSILILPNNIVSNSTYSVVTVMQRLDEQFIGHVFRGADLFYTIQDQRYLIIRDRIRSVIGGGQHSYIRVHKP